MLIEKESVRVGERGRERESERATSKAQTSKDRKTKPVENVWTKNARLREANKINCEIKLL